MDAIQKKYDAIAHEAMKGLSTVVTNSSSEIEKLIIDKSGERELENDIKALRQKLSGAVESFARDTLFKKLEFTHIKEQGLKIWGRTENLAISHFTLSQILHEVASICDNKKLPLSLRKAGTKSALQFFADFLPHLRIDQELRIPQNEFSFLELLGKFDSRSSWWLESLTPLDEGKYYSIRIRKPFTGYPWAENDPHTFHDFLCGYIQTLFNCCADFLRIFAKLDNNAHKSKYALHCSYEQMLTPEILQLRLYITEKYIEEFEPIDQIIHAAYHGFYFGKESSLIDLKESHDYYNDLTTALNCVFNDSFPYDTDLFKELEKRRNDKQNCHEDKPGILLLEIFMFYQNSKIAKLLSIDGEVNNAIKNQFNADC